MGIGLKKEPPMAARITYQDPQITEYEDGTQEIRFTDAEWDNMLRDPVFFGLAGRCGHRITDGNRRFWEAEGCPDCFGAMEHGAPPPPPHFPKVLCGHCGDDHIGVGAVRRCSLS